MYEQRRFPPLAWIPLGAGLLWLTLTSFSSTWTLLLTLPVTGTLWAAGIGQMLWAGDIRINQTLALAGFAGTLIGLGAMGLVGPLVGALLALAAGACFVAAGASAVIQEDRVEGVPNPHLTARLSAMVALDEMVLGLEQFSISVPSGDQSQVLLEETGRARALYEDRGWFRQPERFHTTPPPLEAPEISQEKTGRIDYEHLRFLSGYEPWDEEPGRTRWLSYTANQTAHAYLVRQTRTDRPWMICINGYRMGSPAIDLRAFGRFYGALGLNVLIPVLPLHGLRRVGRISGEGFLSGQILDSVHGEAQAMWDIRRLIAWARGQGARAMGVTGLSLGGYTAALLASLEEGLECAIPGIPATDFARIFWRHGPRMQLSALESQGLGPREVADVLQVVSPLNLKPRVPLEGRMIYGGLADRLVTPDQVRDLSIHWGHPRTIWYQGGHLTFRLDPSIHQGIDATLRDIGWIA